MSSDIAVQVLNTWLKDADNSWSPSKVKYVFKRKKSKNTDLDPVILKLARSGVKIRDITTNEGQIAESYLNYNLVEPDDLLLNPMDIQSGANCSISYVYGVISPAYINLRLKVASSPRFYDYYFKNLYTSRLFFAYGKGVSYDNRWTLSAETLLNYPILQPPHSKQRRIADFLDSETAKIDNLIAKQECLLLLLEEKRRTTITYAVTRGLNPNAKLKETNIPWLGKIPAHWGIYRAKYLFEKIQNKPLESDDVVTAFRDGEVVLRRLRREDGFTFADKEIGYQHVKVGDLVIHAMDAFAGAVGVSKSEGKMSPVCSICRPIRADLSAEYFAQLIRAMTSTNYLVAIAKGIRERSTDFRFGEFSNMTFPLPPLEEQRGIIKKINSENAKSKELKQKIKSQIALLRERRSSLISHAVTGKIKV